MSSYPPSSTRVGSAIAVLLGVSSSTELDQIRCQLVYHPLNPRYTVWVKGTSRVALGAALTTTLKRPFAATDDHWLLQLDEAEHLLVHTDC